MLLFLKKCYFTLTGFVIEFFFVILELPNPECAFNDCLLTSTSLLTTTVRTLLAFLANKNQVATDWSFRGAVNRRAALSTHSLNLNTCTSAVGIVSSTYRIATEPARARVSLATACARRRAPIWMITLVSARKVSAESTARLRLTCAR